MQGRGSGDENHDVDARRRQAGAGLPPVRDLRVQTASGGARSFLQHTVGCIRRRRLRLADSVLPWMTTLILADRHHCGGLNAACIQFIASLDTKGI